VKETIEGMKREKEGQREEFKGVKRYLFFVVSRGRTNREEG
jgi:hypothetical protein